MIKKTDSKPIFNYSVKTKDLPASQGMLHLVRNELKSDIRELRCEMGAQFKQVDIKFVQLESKMNDKFAQVDSRFAQVDARFAQIDSRFDQVSVKFLQIESKLEQVLGSVHQMASEISRMGILMEEQNSRNQIVLEGLTGLFQRQERVESRMDGVERVVQSIAAHAK